MSGQQVKPSDNIEQIRQLLFGEQIQQFRSQISELQKQISDLKLKLDRSLGELKKEIQQLRSDNSEAKQHVENRLESTRKEFSTALKAAQTHLQQALKEVRGDSVARDDLARYFMEIGERLHNGEKILSPSSQDGEDVTNE